MAHVGSGSTGPVVSDVDLTPGSVVSAKLLQRTGSYEIGKLGDITIYNHMAANDKQHH